MRLPEMFDEVLRLFGVIPAVTDIDRAMMEAEMHIHAEAIRNLHRYPVTMMGKGSSVCGRCGGTLEEPLSKEFVVCDICGWPENDGGNCE